MTGLNNCFGRDRRTIYVAAVFAIALAVFVVLSCLFSPDWPLWFPIGMAFTIRLASLALYRYEIKPATEESFFLPPRPSRFFFVKAGPVEGAPLRAPLYVGDIMGFID